MRRRSWFAFATLGAVTVTGLGAWWLMSRDDGGPVAADIAVQKVEGLPADFAAGVDVSSVLSLEASGVVFRDDAGRQADLFRVLADHGVNYVRIRVWNDPYDAQGAGYGGGTVDASRATEIGKRATDAGLRVLVDFHYSDFWADPAKQRAPKAWEGMSNAEKADAAGSYTRDTLTQMKDAGVDVGMVQVGNETNNGVAGVKAWDGVCAIFNSGSAAVREVFPDALVAVHFANPEQEGTYENYAKILNNFGVDYDVFASSYYPFWHGTTENLTTVLKNIADTYGKKVMVAETSWVRTLEDGDGSSNVIGTSDLATAYPISVQGQATAVRDVIQAVMDTGAGIGVFYWEPAWLPVGPPEDEAGNRALWDRDGSGWASSAAVGYDPDAGAWGGSGWDNQSLFAWDGTPLSSLRVFEFARRGATAPRELVQIETPALVLQVGDPVGLPATVVGTYNDGTTEDLAVTWEGDVTSDTEGSFTATGSTANGDPVTASVDVRPLNDLVNPGFEEDDVSMWVFASDAATFAVVDDNVPAAIDARVVNFWSDSAYTLSLSQTVTGLRPGTYRVSVKVHGEDTSAADATLALTASGSEGDWTAPLQLNGWQAWLTGTIPEVTVGADGVLTVGVRGSMGAGDWGFIDGFELVPVDT